MNHHLLTVSAMTIEAEQKLFSERLERVAQVAEARQGRSAPTSLVGWLQRALDTSRFGTGHGRPPIRRRAAVHPTPMVGLRNVME